MTYVIYLFSLLLFQFYEDKNTIFLPLFRTCCHQPWRLDSVAHPQSLWLWALGLPWPLPHQYCLSRGFHRPISTARMVLPTPASVIRWLLRQKLVCAHILVVKGGLEGKLLSVLDSAERGRLCLLTKTHIIRNTAISEGGLDARMPIWGKHPPKEPRTCITINLKMEKVKKTKRHRECCHRRLREERFF